jgi:serine/threonine-protein kinase
MSQTDDIDRETVRITLEVVAGPQQGMRFDFQRHDTFLVGRGSWSHLCVRDDLHFSRHHFRIEIRPPDCYLIDLGSRNGTFVNGDRVSSVFLKDGDVISGGKTKIKVSVSTVVPARSRVQAPTVLGNFSAARTVSLPASAASPGKFPGVQNVPGYELEEELGSGSMGVVFRAVHLATGKQVAIKLISPRQSASEHAMQLFIREASMLGRLDHPHIVRCLDFGYAGGQFFLVMEHVMTVAIDAVLSGRSAASRVRIPCGVVCQILEALDHAHRMSIVHRDIKPENVLLFQDGKKLHAKLADFGLAKNYEYSGLSQISREGDIRGTIAYMPPELIVDCRNARPAGDLYSVGATLYFYLSNEFPFEFCERNKLLAVLEDKPIPLQQRAPHVPAELAEIVHRAMAKKPADRFESAPAMLKAIEKFTAAG